MPRTLDYCGVRSLCGKQIANELFGRTIPDGFDMDHPGDEEAISAIVREFEPCANCSYEDHCEP